MPFEVFRRHQKKMLSIFAILAMFGFVFSQSLSNWSRGSGRGNPVVVDLYNRPVYESDLVSLKQERLLANKFLTSLTQGQYPNVFGGYTTRELVAGLILKHEADRMGIPDSIETARAFLKEFVPARMGYAMSGTLFEAAVRNSGDDVGGSMYLAAIASQIRLSRASSVLGDPPLVTPLDLFETYRDQNERSSFRFVSFPVANFLDKAGDPTDAEVQELYDKYKDVLPDPTRDTPGFKVPREVKVEALWLDGAAIARDVQAELLKDKAKSDADLRTYYEAHKSEYKRPSDLPDDVFQDDPSLTPAPLEPIRELLAAGLSREKAQDLISDRLIEIEKSTLNKYGDKYLNHEQDVLDAKKSGQSVRPLEAAPNLADLAKANGLQYQATPLLSYDQLKSFGPFAAAFLGSDPNKRNDPSKGADRKFADVFFEPKSALYQNVELCDSTGKRFVAWKTDDVPPHVAPLSQARPDVIAAWRFAKARTLAEAAAKQLAETIKKEGGKFKPGEDLAGGRPIRAIESVSKLSGGLPSMPSMGFQGTPALPSPLPQIPDAGKEIRDALFTLKPGEVAVEPDQPKSTYYVLALDRREPATFTGLFGPNTTPIMYQFEAMEKARAAYAKARMDALYAKAGLKEGWTPPEEKARDMDDGD